MAKAKNERIKEFKTFIYSKLKERWYKQPKQITTLEKQYITEFLDSL